MKTNIFSHELKRIKLFCKHAKDGFIVIEVNDVISKSVIIKEISDEYEMLYLKDLNINKKTREDVSNEIFVIDTIGDDAEHMNFRRWAINLNYNRDLLAKMGCVIFICTTRLVNELISFSSSFWSFVALHITMSKKLDCVYSPVYIQMKNQYHFYENYNEYAKTDIQAKKILNASSVSKLKKFLDELWVEYGDEFIYYKRVKQFGDVFFERRQYINAELCFNAVFAKMGFQRMNVKLKIDILSSLASVYFELKNYHNSLQCLDEVRKLSESDAEYFSNCELAILWNNIGVLLLKCKNSSLDEVLSCFNESLRLVNYEDVNIVLSEILYNACLINYVIGDYNQSRYYIDLSMKLLNRHSRFQNIIMSRFSVISAFMMINEGDFSNVTEIMTESLTYLRNELDENHIYILEAHYTFALVYMHLGKIDKAEKCITKALKAVKLIKADELLNICVWTLYGIVQYYIGNYNETKNYLSLVRRNSYNKVDANAVFYSDIILRSIDK